MKQTVLLLDYYGMKILLMYWGNFPSNKTHPLYNTTFGIIFAYSDYIDRITFQKQIWQFNEMSSLIKTFYNNKIYNDSVYKNT